MGIFSNIFDYVYGPRLNPLPTPAPVPLPAPQAPAKSFPASQRRRFGVVASQSSSGPGTSWPGIQADDYNREYLSARLATIARSQDLDVNNPDVRGFHRSRTAQVIGGDGLLFQASIPEEKDLNAQLNALRARWSLQCDASGQRRSEAKLQEQTCLSQLVHGDVLVQRVWINDPARLLPLAISIIPGPRVSTPYDKAGDPTISYGIQYSDEYRTTVRGYWVKRPDRNIGNAFLREQIWDYVEAQDAVLIRLSDVAGLDRSLPATVAIVRMLRNKGEFIESSMASARAQAKRSFFIECAPGTTPYDQSANDAQSRDDYSSSEPVPAGWVVSGESEIWYGQSGEKMIAMAANLPGPSIKDFMEIAEQRCARGVGTSLSRWTKAVQSSYSAGRQEEQQDEPVVGQLRGGFVNGWRVVHGWFVDACVLTGLVQIPGYSESTRELYHACAVIPPRKEHINPTDTRNAEKTALMIRATSPQRVCASNGEKLSEILDEWVEALVMCREREKAANLPEGSLLPVLDGTAVAPIAGAEPSIPPQPAVPPEPWRERHAS